MSDNQSKWTPKWKLLLVRDLLALPIAFLTPIIHFFMFLIFFGAPLDELIEIVAQQGVWGVTEEILASGFLTFFSMPICPGVFLVGAVGALGCLASLSSWRDDEPRAVLWKLRGFGVCVSLALSAFSAAWIFGEFFG